MASASKLVSSGSPRGSLASGRTVGKVWKHFWLSQLLVGRGPGVREARYATEHPTVHRAALHNQNDLVQTSVVPKVGLSVLSVLNQWLDVGLERGLAEALFLKLKLQALFSQLLTFP